MFLEGNPEIKYAYTVDCTLYVRTVHRILFYFILFKFPTLPTLYKTKKNVSVTHTDAFSC
jgi:hypothetical protein